METGGDKWRQPCKSGDEKGQVGQVLPTYARGFKKISRELSTVQSVKSNSNS